MSHTVKLSFENGAVAYITPSRARRLRKKGEAYIVSQSPFELRMRAQIQQWSSKSEGRVMNGAVLMRQLPHLAAGSTRRRAEMKLNERAVVRKRAGLTQHQVGKRSGVHASRISLWENGEIELAPKEVEKIAGVIAAALSYAPAVSTTRKVAQVLSLALACGAGGTDVGRLADLITNGRRQREQSEIDEIVGGEGAPKHGFALERLTAPAREARAEAELQKGARRNNQQSPSYRRWRRTGSRIL